MYIPTLQVRTDSILIYYLPTEPPGRKEQLLLNLSSAQTYSGKVTTGAARRILSACDILLQKSKTRNVYNPVTQTVHPFKVAFTTLTIPEPARPTAQEGYELLLKPYLRYIRDKYLGNSYVWKAEFQERGALHYHLLQNEFIPWYVIKWKWNNVLKSAGYLKEWAMKHHNFNPPSTDIHKVYQVKNVAAYIAKYMSKSDQSKPTKGKVWDCSTDVKGKRFSYPMDYTTEQNIRNYINQNPSAQVSLERCTIIKSSAPVHLLSAGLRNHYQKWQT